MEPTQADPAPMRVDLLVVHLDGRAHVHVMFDKDRPTGRNTANISLDGDEFDPLITPSVAADIANRLRTAQPYIAGLLERLECRGNETMQP